MVRWFGPWGVWPVGAGLAWLAGRRLAGVWCPGASAADRRAATAMLALALATLVLRLQAALGLLQPALLLAALAAAAFLPRSRAEPLAPAAWHERGSSWGLGVGLAAVALAVAAARWLPIWQWDSAGYHLTFVDFVLQGRSLAGLPRDAPYLSTYPHGADLLLLGQRLLLPDDRLVDLGQLPMALAGAAVIAALAEREGAGRAAALAAGALWLALPAVFLQIPTDYVDVAAAADLLGAVYWALAIPSTESLLLFGLSAGLLLGAKPSSPPAVAVLAALVSLRAWKAGRRQALAAALACVAVVGGESYARNVAEHGNPIWPVAVTVGPLQLPGLHPVSALLASGSSAPHLTGPWPERILLSWAALHPLPAFDMRIGGFGPLFLLLALPAALLGLWRRRSWALALSFGATLATADPSIARYTLALPGLCLALAAAEAARLAPTLRPWAHRLAALAGGVGLWLAVPGLTGGGPPLLAFARMTDEARMRALGPDGPPGSLVDLRRSVPPGEAIAFGERFDLAHLLWEPDGSNRVLRLPEGLAGERLDAWLASNRVRLLLVGPDEPAGAWVRAHPAEFLPEQPCGGSEAGCEVYRLATSTRSSSAPR